jgi:predicted nucleic acid-binding protein
MDGVSFLVDTNLLVYSYDRSESRKQLKARQVLDWLAGSGAAVLSTQVLAEFFWTVTRKLPERMSAEEACQRMENYIRSWRVVAVTPGIVLESGRGVLQYGLPFWDAQIWATAKLNQIPRVLSEDFQHGRRIEGVEFLNPFKTDLFTKE